MRGLLLALLLYESVALECQVCTEGTFCFNDGNFSCPLHSTSQPQSGNITACVCQAGYYALSNHTCTRCPDTKFCPGDETIQSCPKFQETTIQLASSLSQCFCIQGYQNNSGTCQKCPRNSYKIQTGPSACTSCGTNEVLLQTGSVANTCICDLGNFRNTDNACQACASGKFKQLHGDFACSGCPEGSYTTNTTSCVSCPVNSLSVENSSGVSSCLCKPAYEGANGICTACAAGKFKNNTSLESCQVCSSNTYSPITSSECTECPEFSISPSESDTVSDCECNGGYEFQASNTTCNVCIPGKFKAGVGNSASCQECETKQYTPDSSAHVSCQDCPANTYADTGSVNVSSCVCEAGYEHFSSSTGCVLCADGYAKASIDNTDCLPCSVNTSRMYSESTPSADVCVPCADHASAVGGSAQCLCDSGFTAVDASVPHIQCAACHAGSFKYAIGNGDCQACLPGTFSGTGALNCSDCAAGTYQPQNEQSNCLSCPQNSLSVAKSTSINECVCNPGYEPSATNGLTCKLCVQGKYSDGIQACSACPSGHSTIATGSQNASDCQLCTGTQYEKNNLCIDCLSQQVSDENRSICACKAGYEFKSGSCVACLLGTFRPLIVIFDSDTCQFCDGGQSTNSVGSTSIDDCVQCSSGTYGKQMMNTFQICFPCGSNDGYISPPGSDNSDACTCNAGYYGESCDPCQAATYKNDTGDHDCTSCPTGYVTPETESRLLTSFEIACVGCGINTYAATAQACTPCGQNRVSPALSSSQTDCICDAGHEEVGASCSACEGGKFKAEYGNIACTECNNTSYQSLNASLSCQPCPEKTRTLSSGSNSADDCLCEEGYEFIATGCQLCVEGKYKTSLSGNCISCTDNKYYRESLPPYTTDKCESCPEKSLVYGNGFTASKCQCNTGTVRKSKTECSVAPAGVFVAELEVKLVFEFAMSRTEFEEQREQFVQKIKESFDDEVTVEVSIETVITSRRLLTESIIVTAVVTGIATQNITATKIDLQVQLSNTSCTTYGFNFANFTTENDCSTSTTVSGGVLSCPTFSTSLPGSTSLENCSCIAGRYGAYDNCTLCPPNYYCPGGTHAEKCPGNSSTLALLRGASNISQCFCNAGFYWDDALFCVPCEIGSFCFANNLQECPDNSTSAPFSFESNQCICEFGFIMTSENVCRSCEIDEICNGQGSVVKCATGAYAEHTHDWECVCTEGSFCSGYRSCTESASCMQCPENHYCKDNEDIECPSNSESPANSIAVANCVCLDGYYRNNDTCVACPFDSYCHSEQRFYCSGFDTNLILKEELQTSRDDCYCKDGLFRLNKKDLCKPCPLNFFCPSANQLVLPNVVSCLTNAYTLNESMTSVSDCICDVGTRLTETDKIMQCIKCEEGQRCSHGNVVEFSCNLQKRTPNIDHSRCVCIPGYEQVESGICQPCQPGFVKLEAGDHQCIPCLVNHFSFNSTTCLPCPSFTSSQAAAASCDCDRPLVGNAGDCRECIVDHYYEFTGAHCLSCPQNSSTKNTTGMDGIESCVCDRGFERFNSTYCSPCVVGKYEDAGVCNDCGIGASSMLASFGHAEDACFCNVSKCQKMVWGPDCMGACQMELTQCEECKPGFFKRNVSRQGHNDVCQPCAFDTFQPSFGQHECLQCHETTTTVTIAAHNASECVCRAGHEPLEIELSGQYACQECKLGFKKSDAGNFQCTACEIGKYSNTTGALECLSCASTSTIVDAITTLDTNSTSIDNCTCVPGKYLNSSKCTLCARGSFKEAPGVHDCHFCGSHLYDYLVNMYGTNETGATDSSHCVLCPDSSGYDPNLIPQSYVMNSIEKCQCFPGYSNFSQYHGCSLCDSFKFKEGYSNDECEYCRNDNEYFVSAIKPCSLCQLHVSDSVKHSNAYNRINPNFTWATSVHDCACDLGYYHGTTDVCMPCALGTFRDHMPDIYCTSCALNKYQNEEGKTACKDCQDNSFTSANESTGIDYCLCKAGYELHGNPVACNACEPGEFKDQPDEYGNTAVCESCSTVGNNFYSDTPAAIACSPCGAQEHSVSPHNSLDTCLCNGGFGSSPCSVCLHGSFSSGGLFGDRHRECQLCPQGKTTAQNKSVEVEECLCQAGHGTSNASSIAECQECKNGFYAVGLQNIPCTHCGYGGITEPEIGSIHFDSCMCNHAIGLYEVL